ncbi:hypothetical protein PHJA_001017600 [Phtheirospermum japonicum]|uniref:Secreted protein n=1 Tax=Phtheirospermum japonicum TaxID=374723 RepID=A0A830BS01_9LAMI|nr:hypothetical protein PHJA_001017600 [Phtheirospermum japonicum]
MDILLLFVMLLCCRSVSFEVIQSREIPKESRVRKRGPPFMETSWQSSIMHVCSFRHRVALERDLAREEKEMAPFIRAP